MKLLILLLVVGLLVFSSTQVSAQTQEEKKQHDKLYSFTTFVVGEGTIQFTLAEYDKISDKDFRTTGKNEKIEIDFTSHVVTVDGAKHDLPENAQVMVGTINSLINGMLAVLKEVKKEEAKP
jgi:hypothetical protein